jgi:hypothetical protein
MTRYTQLRLKEAMSASMYFEGVSLIARLSYQQGIRSLPVGPDHYTAH